jgi:MFS family permease
LKVLGGYLSIMFGAKIVLGMAILIGSILTLIVPVAAPISYVALVASRFLTGVAHGSFWPACATLWVCKVSYSKITWNYLIYHPFKHKIVSLGSTEREKSSGWNC